MYKLNSAFINVFQKKKKKKKNVNITNISVYIINIIFFKRIHNNILL